MSSDVRPRRRPTLAQRTTLVITATVALAVLVAALLSIGLVRQAARTEARRSLAQQANVVTGLVDAAIPARTGQALRALRATSTPVARVQPNGTVRGDALAVAAAERGKDQLLAGQPVSLRFQAGGRTVIAEGRPLSEGGGLVLARAQSDAIGPAVRLLWRQLLALLVGLVVAVVAGVLLARWLAKPLQRMASAAHRLAAGERDVVLDPTGPQEVAEVADAVNTLSAELGFSEQRQREFLLTVSHELRTPLTAVRGYAEALADGVTEPESVPAVGRTLVAEADRLQRLVGDLLDLARLDAVDLRIDAVDVDLAALLADAEPVWRSRCGQGGQQLLVERPSAPVLVRTDPVRVRQVLDGLAENAVRVTPSGRPVVLAVRHETDHAVLEVRDGGPGLTDEDLTVAFERSELHRRYAGQRPVSTGLGLAIVATIARRLGGQAQAAHAPEGGACFRLLLPTVSAGEPGQTA
ncbi:sensor histidine kinase [Angustibacter luteus]|uniref:Signal transduction histidine-protein kinase/phosphatase MprB n=1 Tax=Angustibacter luteus TaxID=658456 RepID=A0ABW1J9T5_9ACTN